MHKSLSYMSMLGLALGVVFFVGNRAASSGQSGGLVRLQPVTPGTAQVGHLNIDGTATAGQLAIGGATPGSAAAGISGQLVVDNTASNAIVGRNHNPSAFWPSIVGAVPADGYAGNAGVYGVNAIQNTHGFLGYGANGVYGNAPDAGTWAGAFDGKVRFNGNIAINRADSNYPMSFANGLGDKIALWGTSGPSYGFGVQSSLLQIHTDTAGGDIAFGYGSSASMTETMRIKGNGTVGIGVSPSYRLQVAGRTYTTDFTMSNGGAANTVLLGAAGGVASWGSVGNAQLAFDGASLNKVTNGQFAMVSGGIQGVATSKIELLQADSAIKVQLTPNSTGGGLVRTYGPNGALNAGLTFLGGNPNNGFLNALDSAGASQAGAYVDANGFGVVFGDTKSFIVPDPDDAHYNIVYACVEGPEAAMYTRGTGHLVNGEAHVTLPDHFRKLASEDGITVTLTPNSRKSLGLCTEDKSTSGFSVYELNGGKGNYDFDWEIKAVRKGHENWQSVRPWDDALPDGDKKQQWEARLRSIAARRNQQTP